MRRFLASVVFAAGLTGQAEACLNDIELPSHEREFRADYASNAAPRGTPSGDNTRYWLVLGVGTALLAGGLFVAVSGGRSGS